VQVRLFAKDDLAAVVAIQRSSPEAAQWSAADYARVARGDLQGWVAEAGSHVVGFLVARRMADELEILNLAVGPAARRLGVGSLLLREALAAAQRSGARSAFLEMRESNPAAMAFYARHAFAVSGRRARYYSRPEEDALVLSRTLA